ASKRVPADRRPASAAPVAGATSNPEPRPAAPPPAVPAAQAASEARSPAPVVHDVRIEGNERLDRDTVLYYTTLRAGAVYDTDVMRSDFRKLWETGFFENLSLETRETPQ